MLLLTPGQTHDIVGARALLAAVPAMRKLIDDKAFDADDLRAYLIAQGTLPVISPMPNRLTRRPSVPPPIASAT